MKRITRPQLIFALCLAAAAVAVAVIAHDYFVAVVFIAIAIFGCVWQLRLPKNPPSDVGPNDH